MSEPVPHTSEAYANITLHLRKNPLSICGWTDDARPVLAGAFQLADTHGFPLDLACIHAHEIDAVLSVPHFWASAIEAGWTEERAAQRLESEWTDGATPFRYAEHRRKIMALYLAADALSGRRLRSDEVGREMREHIERDGGIRLMDHIAAAA